MKSEYLLKVEKKIKNTITKKTLLGIFEMYGAIGDYYEILEIYENFKTIWEEQIKNNPSLTMDEQKLLRKPHNEKIKKLRKNIKTKTGLCFLPLDCFSDWTKRYVDDENLIMLKLDEDITYDLYRLRIDFNINDINYDNRVILFMNKEYYEIYESGGADALTGYIALKNIANNEN